jgi:hypothetical protein
MTRRFAGPLTALCFFAFSQTGWTLIQLRTEIETDGEKLSPTLIVNENEWSAVETDTLNLKLKVTRDSAERAIIQADIQRTEGGKTVLHAKPTIATRWDKSAEIESRKDDGNLLYRLSITPSILPEMPATAPPATAGEPTRPAPALASPVGLPVGPN